MAQIYVKKKNIKCLNQKLLTNVFFLNNNNYVSIFRGKKKTKRIEIS